jgi:hypothetical protein
MRTLKFFLYYLFLNLLLASCGAIEDVRAFTEIDCIPPQLLGIKVKSPYAVSLSFTEATVFYRDSLHTEPALEILEMESSGTDIILSTEDPLEAGSSYTLSAQVEDSRGNSMSFVTSFYGYNDNLPFIIFNEFITKGSGNHPDIVELYVVREGNTGGLCIYQGTKTYWVDKFVLPDFNVANGDYILLHFKPEGIETEINEIHKSESGGRDTSDNAYDFWVEEGTGLSGNNGVLTLYTNPNGELMDAAPYSNRTSDSDEKYRGFGSKKVMNWMDEIAVESAWFCENGSIKPEDVINPERSTATRSICRGSDFDDTDTNGDWHIVPTRGSTFGYQNTDEVFSD